MTTSGMVQISLDPQGRMYLFRAVPPQVEEAAAAVKQIEPAVLFTAAGLDISQFQPTEPKWLPLAMADTRSAWTGIFPGRPENPIRIEAAYWRGKPVYFHTIGPWTVPSRMQVHMPSLGSRVGNLAFLSLIMITGIAAIFMARTNLRLGRGDRQGALKLGIVAVAISVIGWIFGSHHRLADDEIALFFIGMGLALWQGFLLWLLYLALEPHVRRRWPQTLISWSRLLAGRLRDPLVGRDILIGLAFGIANDLIIAIDTAIHNRLGTPPNTDVDLDTTLGFGHMIAGATAHFYSAMQTALVFFFLIFLLRLVLRRQWIAAVAFTMIFVAVKALPTSYPAVSVPFITLIFGLIVVSLMRFGLVTLITSIFVTDMVPAFIFTTDFSAWYGTGSLVAGLAILGLAIFAYRNSIARHA